MSTENTRTTSRPEIQTPAVPNRNLPEHDLDLEKDGPREYQADRAPESRLNTHIPGRHQTLEPSAPGVREEAAP